MNLRSIFAIFFALLSCDSGGEPFNKEFSGLDYTIHPSHCEENREIVVACIGQCQSVNVEAITDTAKKMSISVAFVSIWSREDLFKIEFDSIILEGGADISLDFYNNSWLEQRLYPELIAKINENSSPKDKEWVKWRDELELAVLDEYFHNDKLKNIVLLGICRGMQILSVSSGLPLYIDIPMQLDLDGFNNSELIHLEPDTTIGKIYDNKVINAAETHHQAMHFEYFKEFSSHFPEVQVSATSNHGVLPEAIEFSNRKAIGVQFHPEISSDSVKYPIFSWLLSKSCQ